MRPARALVWVTALVALPLAACEVLFGIDRFTAVDAADAAPKTDAATDGGRDAGDLDAPAEVSVVNGCPSGRGPAMVRIGDLCIDTTEVSEVEYAVFLSQDAGPQPPSCAWNKSYIPGEGPAVRPDYCRSGDTKPQGCVDWCDATMFCQWAGKRLCGAPAGGASPFGTAADGAKSEWFAACAGANANAYPYGNTYDPSLCNGAFGPGTGSSLPVEGLRGCEGSVKGLFQMSGNVWEWENSCGPADAGLGPNAEPCRIRGGSMYDQDAALLRCDARMTAVRDFQQANVGFRCCAQAAP